MSANNYNNDKAVAPQVIVVQQPSQSSPSVLRTLYSVFHFVVSIFAIFLSFKCNQAFDLTGFLAALFFPYIYILYKYGTTDNFCGVKLPTMLKQ